MMFPTEPNPVKRNKLPTYDELLAQNAALMEQVHQMREELQALRDEVARLKKQKHM